MKKITFLLSMLISLSSLGQVIITEIADPNNAAGARFVELHNLGDNSVDLSGYYLKRWTNANPDPQTSTVDLSDIGTLSSKGFALIAANGTTFETTFNIAPDIIAGTGGPADSNGDDKIALYDSTDTLLDIYGTPGSDSNNVDGPENFEDGRAERKASVVSGNSTWDGNEWNVSNDQGYGNGATDAPAGYDPGSWIGNSSSPIVSIDSPSNNSTVGDTSLNVEVTVTNFEITQNTNDPKDGYVYYKLFENGTDTSVQPNLEDSSSSTTIALTNLIEGTHTLEVSLVDNSFTALDPAVSQTISFTVSLGQVCFDLSSGQELFDIVTVTPNTDFDEWFLSNGTYSMNGYVGGSEENVESWLVFGPLDMSGASGTKLEFDLGESYGATDLVIAVSTDYTSCPSGANWSTVTTLTDPGFISLDLSSVTDSNVFIGVQYADDGVDGYSGYTMSNVVMKSSGACPSLGQRPVSDCGTCDLTLGTAGIICGTNTVGDNNDGVTITIPYSGVEASITSVTTTSNGQIGGDNPAAVADGTITITGLSEGEAWDITLNGGDCDGITLNGTVAASNCDPVAIVINEILADPAPDIPGDSNGDGTRNSTEDEFIEFYNTGLADFDISGYVISDGSNGGDNTRHTFEQGTVIPANSFLVVFGGGTPTGFANGTAIVSSSGGLGLNNGTDSVILKNASGGVVLQVDYTDGGNDQSIGRSPDFTGDFALHTTISNALFSPGLENNDPSLSIQGALKNMFKVYPNPASNGKVTITSQFTEAITATVFDVLGKEVINERVDNNTLDVSQLNKGIYLMKLTQNGASATQKLVIK